MFTIEVRAKLIARASCSCDISRSRRAFGLRNPDQWRRAPPLPLPTVVGFEALLCPDPASSAARSACSLASRSLISPPHSLIQRGHTRHMVRAALCRASQEHSASTGARILMRSVSSRHPPRQHHAHSAPPATFATNWPSTIGTAAAAQKQAPEISGYPPPRSPRSSR